MERKKEMVELNVSHKRGFYNYEMDEFIDKEKVLRAYYEYMRDFEDEDIDIDNIDIHTDEDFNYYLDELFLRYLLCCTGPTNCYMLG